MDILFTSEQFKDAIVSKLRRHFGKDPDAASERQVFRAAALTLMDCLAQEQMDTLRLAEEKRGRTLHYLSMEFLLGRSLLKNAFNLGLSGPMSQALRELGREPGDIFETEPDAGLGNGGLGRLAACYLDSMATLGLNATGYSICYENGIFAQRVIDGRQVELPDEWLQEGSVWLTAGMDEVEEVRFGGNVELGEEEGRVRVIHTDYTPVLAVPMDMPVSGYKNGHVNRLRLWDAKSPTALDMGLFARGEYLKALETSAMASVITKILYPDDNHMEGKSLRLKQQYFFVSATVQSIVRGHRRQYGTLKSFHLKHVLHINDTHPSLAIPELMRILLDEEGLSWEEAWRITTRTVAYTNHTVMAEALERWPQSLVASLLPRIWMILCEINNRYLDELRRESKNSHDDLRQMAIIWDGEVRMANLCVHACFAVNGVSELHSDILRQVVFKRSYELKPTKFRNVTNGIDHRRWLAQANPALAELVGQLIGDEFLREPAQLARLAECAGDGNVLRRLAGIKCENKRLLAEYMTRTAGVASDHETVFDVQVKRIHEYKRQLLNLMHVMYRYNRLKDGLGDDYLPHTFFIGGKAAPGYHMAKRIIQLIIAVAERINADPQAKGRVALHYVENYRVSLAEMLMPAAEISEQISLASMEASGTGNMKFMLNGALTVGTMDGANVEIHDLVGQDNIFIFGLRSGEVQRIDSAGGYSPILYYNANPELKRVVDQIAGGFYGSDPFPDVTAPLLLGNGNTADRYKVLCDFKSYCAAHDTANRAYADKEHWNRMSLINVAKAGYFAADRSVAQYAKHIWGM